MRRALLVRICVATPVPGVAARPLAATVAATRLARAPLAARPGCAMRCRTAGARVADPAGLAGPGLHLKCRGTPRRVADAAARAPAGGAASAEQQRRRRRLVFLGQRAWPLLARDTCALLVSPALHARRLRRRCAAHLASYRRLRGAAGGVARPAACTLECGRALAPPAQRRGLRLRRAESAARAACCVAALYERSQAQRASAEAEERRERAREARRAAKASGVASPPLRERSFGAASGGASESTKLLPA